ncbi:HPr-rel-A system PqqD family peptide chaperone [Hankyongella ginsenosidimutans]|uniref:HPr-rel-A system PqqD family peptide chaperone n=1 Tax=Hankyongella ginsenosidimutans TaxID=1763828 RepID=A0A4D7CBB2_9SPHN|nr:HPr-rel-A system PqqD family peptide chaperone [Hankyongella ginsenosidimutans]QCI79286.1 HPr-rel-A system PqqD family peptide chaperone [Hankyongella ginsenosidimutans]TXG82756.1 MAG: HPr-rel-A system PqqD family peptide chaperone [Sphingomonadales bacterium]
MAEPVYHHPPEPDRFLRREADGLTVLFDRVSGETHILAPEAIALLDCLRDSPADARTALERLQAHYEMETADDLLEGIARQLEALYDLGLANKPPGRF